MNDEMMRMQENIERIRLNMANAARRVGRRPEEVLLCAACKTRTCATVEVSAKLAIDLFGENHVQELVEKSEAGSYLGKPAHFIGHLQTNKIKKVIGRADVIESIDSARLLLAVEAAAAKAEVTQSILVEVNIGGEESKTGLDAESLFPLLELAAAQPHIRVEGLMAIPPALTSDSQNRAFFAQMRELARKAGELHYPNVAMETLSMGMSDDYENAILEGSTIVRIGTAIYGARDYSKKA